MKGKRYTTEDKIQILREADRGERTIQGICQEANISEVTFHRWKKQVGQMEVKEARRLKELEREHGAQEDAGGRDAEEPCVELRMRKKVVSPARRRAFAQEVVEAGVCSQRRACRYLGLARSTFNYRGRPPTPAEEQLRKRLLALSAEHPRYGYRRIAALRRREGWRVGKRHIQRLRRDAGLRVPPTKRKVVRRGVSTGLPTSATHRNHAWTWDFIANATVCGGALKLMTILDEYTRECHVLWAELALKAADVLQWLQKAVEKHEAPE